MYDNLSPHLTDGSNSSLSYLSGRAIAQSGEMSQSTTEGDVSLLMLDWANEIVDDIRSHPYYDNVPVLGYYTSLEDKRPIADTLMISGLLAKYMVWLGSKKAPEKEARYFARLNQQMYYAATGGSIALELQVVDQPVQSDGEST